MKKYTVYCAKCDSTFETKAKKLASCPDCGKRIHVSKKNRNQSGKKKVEDKGSSNVKSGDPTEKLPEKKVISFQGIMDGFQAPKTPVPDLVSPVKTPINVSETPPPIPLIPGMDVGLYFVALADILQSQLLEKKPPTTKQKAVLVTETMKICQVYLTVGVPDEDAIKPVEIPAWGFAVATVIVLALPFILEKLKKNKKGEDEDGRDESE